MAITFVGANAAASTSVTIPAHQAGDLLVIQSVNEDGNNLSAPAGWTTLVDAEAPDMTSCVGYRVATGSGTTSGTWPSAAITSVVIYRGVDQADPVGASATSVTDGSWSVPGLSLEVTDGSSWVYVAIAGSFGVPPTPSGCTLRSGTTSSGEYNYVFDTNTGVSSWSGSNSGSTSRGNVRSSIEIKAAAADPGENFNEAATALAADVSFTASGTKGSSSSANTLSSDVSVSSTGAAAANVSADLDVAPSLTASGTAAAVSSTSLDTDAATSATGSAATDASADFDAVMDFDTATGGFSSDSAVESFDTSLGVSASGTAAASASTSLDTDASLTSSGLVDASTDSEHMSVQMSSDPYPIIDVSGVSNVLEAVALFDEVTALLGDDAVAEFSLTVDFAAAATVNASGTASYPVTLSFGTASVDGSSAADANPLSVTVSFDDASGIRDTSVSVSDFDSLVTLDGADASRSVGTQASGLGVNATLGSVTVTSMLWSIYLSVSTVETEIDVPELVTTIPDLSDVAPIPSLDILTQLTDLEIETIVSDIAIQTTIADQTVETVLED